MKTSIEWTDHSINPIRARGEGERVGHYCEKVSPGCAHCYASTLQGRFRMPAFLGAGSWGSGHGEDPNEAPNGVAPFLDASKLQEVLRRKKPTKYFWCDMTDMFGPWVPDEWIDQCFAAMALTPQHTHLVLTKRAERMRDYLLRDGDGVSAALRSLVNQWPLPNVWLGTSVENQMTADERIGYLLQTPAAVRFLSCEPLLGSMDLSSVYLAPTPEDEDGAPYPGPLHWVIVGGESGAKARPCEVNWIRSIRDQCREASVSCFVKQLGARPVFNEQTEHGDWLFCDIKSRKGSDMAEWPDDLRVREFPTG